MDENVLFVVIFFFFYLVQVKDLGVKTNKRGEVQRMEMVGSAPNGSKKGAERPQKSKKRCSGPKHATCDVFAGGERGGVS
jgi:hypothetical protein